VLRALLMVIASIAFSTAPATAESLLDEILSRGVLRVGTTGDYPPFSAHASDGSYSGLDIDSAESLGSALGVRVDFVATRWTELIHDLDSGAFDIAMGGVSINLDRAKRGFFSEPYLRDGKTPIVRCADQGQFETLEMIDRQAVKVIVNPGGTNEKFDRAHLRAAQIAIWPDNLTIFDAIIRGKADVMITDASETLYQQKLHKGVLCAVHADRPFDFAEKAYLMRRDFALKEFVDQWLHLNISSGAEALLQAKWLN